VPRRQHTTATCRGVCSAAAFRRDSWAALDAPVCGDGPSGVGDPDDGRNHLGRLVIFARYLPGATWRRANRHGCAYCEPCPTMWKVSFPICCTRPDAKPSVILQMLRQRLQSPLSSSCGRLFRSMAALAGIRDINVYEGQAAIEWEQILNRPHAYSGKSGGRQHRIVTQCR